MDFRYLAPLFLVSLTAGYHFSSRCNFSKWPISRFEGQRLLFESTQWGLLLTIGAWVVGRLTPADWRSQGASIIADTFSVKYKSMEPFLQAYPFIGAFILAVLLPFVLNWLLHDEGRKSVEKYGNELEKMVLLALDNNRMISFTLSNKKVYIGWPVETPVPQRSGAYLRISPALSGYRDPNTNELCLTSQYLGIYTKILKKEIDYLKIEDFHMVIRSEEIYHANLYEDDERLLPAFFNIPSGARIVGNDRDARLASVGN